MDEKTKITKKPNYHFWYPHLLKALHELGGEAKAGVATKKTSGFFEISDDVSEAVYRDKNGWKSYVIDHQIHLARRDLAATGYIGKSKHGVWILTNEAKKEVKNIFKNEDNTAFINKVSKEYKLQSGQQGVGKKSESVDNKQSKEDFVNEQSEEERQLQEERQQSQKELDVIKGMDPYGFERLCARIFEKLKYKDVEVTQKSRDGGLDGFGYLTFGLVRFKVVFQAKRYKNTPISGSEISELLGTMMGIRAEKGVFITTSKFSPDAIKRADELGSMITLINGEDLIQLLREYEIGYSDNVINREFFNKI